MATKFMRALPYNTGSVVANENALVLKFMYEFWGYCVNGTSSLNTPGGFASSYLGSPVSYNNLPAGFTETNPSTTLSSGYTLPVSTIAVASTSGFPLAGTLIINGNQTVTYTNISGNTFTGCTGGSGTVTTGNPVVGQIYLASGSDGSTITGSSTFTAQSSTPFTPSMIGKYLVMWAANSGLSDDSIYQITAVPTSSTVVVNPNNGGTPNSATLHPTFTTRSNINYRVVDIQAASQINTLSPGQYLVFQFNSGNINPGQASSQCQIYLRQNTPPFSGTAMQNFGLVGSPSGTWNGTGFVGFPTTTLNATQTIATGTDINVTSTAGFPIQIGGSYQELTIGSTIVQYTGISGNSFTGITVLSGPGGSTPSGTTVTLFNPNSDTMAEQNATTNTGGFWNGNYINTLGYLTMIADSDFLLLHDKSGNNTSGSVIHIETPYRLYPQANDPNPFTIMIDGVNGLSPTGNTSTTLANYGGGFAMVGTDGITRKHDVLVKSMTGDSNFGNGSNGAIFGTVPGTSLSNFTNGFNVYNGTAVSSECILSTHATVGQFCLARCKLKNVRIAGPYIPAFHKIGNVGQYIHLTNGICWPWDNTILPFNLMPQGF
jgi:hypothetical protein